MWNVWIQRRSRKVNLARDQVSELIGPGWVDFRQLVGGGAGPVRCYGVS